VNAYNSEGRPATFEGVSVTYDALDRAVQAGSHEFVYDPGGAKLAVMSGGTNVSASVPLPGGGEAVYSASTLQFYRHADNLGSSRLASTPSRAHYSSTAYAPEGEPYQEAGTQDRSFTGQKQDIATGQYDFLLRDYNPVQGRWWVPDPAGASAVSPANPQTWNRYAYVAGVPTETTDSAGLCGNGVFGGVGQAAGTPAVSAQSDFASSIGADLVFPFQTSGHGESVGESLMGVQEAAWRTGGALATAVSAIQHISAPGGHFTLFGYSGGGQIIQAALSLFPESVRSRATVVDLSPGFGIGPASVLPDPDLTISGPGGLNALVAASAIANGMSPGPNVGTACGHDANCEFTSASTALMSMASPSCGTTPETFSHSGGGASPALVAAGAAIDGTLFGWGITGSWIGIINMYFDSMTANVTVSSTPPKPIIKK